MTNLEKNNVANLITSVDNLAEEVELAKQAFDRRVTRVERDRVFFVTALALVIAVLFMVGYSVWRTSVTAAANTETNQRLNVVIQESLCPVYGLVLGGYNPNSRPPEAREEYNRTFAQMNEAYRVLLCQNAIVPPRIGG